MMRLPLDRGTEIWFYGLSMGIVVDAAPSRFHAGLSTSNTIWWVCGCAHKHACDSYFLSPTSRERPLNVPTRTHSFQVWHIMYTHAAYWITQTHTHTHAVLYRIFPGRKFRQFIMTKERKVHTINNRNGLVRDMSWQWYLCTFPYLLNLYPEIPRNGGSKVRFFPFDDSFASCDKP